ncbi:MAG: SCO1664 family protein, partial [Chloroflexota bacterium]
MERAQRHLWDDAAAARTTNGWPAEEIERFLANGDIVAAELIPWGSNYTFAIAVDCDGQRSLAIYKPLRGEAPLWDFPRGTLYRREYAAYAAARIIGWDFIPPTVIRDGPHGVGSVQLFVENEPANYFELREQHCLELQRICLFDIIANNADRKAGHCLKGADDRIWGIDHGLTFNVQPKLRTVIWEFAGEPVPEQLQTELLDFRTDPERVRAVERVLGKALAREERTLFLKRVDYMLGNPVFPQPYSRRA